jgi:hypothetical protein
MRLLVNAQEQEYELKSAFKAGDVYRVITCLLKNFTSLFILSINHNVDIFIQTFHHVLLPTACQSLMHSFITVHSSLA